MMCGPSGVARATRPIAAVCNSRMHSWNPSSLEMAMMCSPLLLESPKHWENGTEAFNGQKTLKSAGVAEA